MANRIGKTAFRQELACVPVKKGHRVKNSRRDQARSAGHWTKHCASGLCVYACMCACVFVRLCMLECLCVIHTYG